ncbi:CU044_5270 family protein [Streptomyces nitrosporeus]|uniref:CU044_5270 family protein n=1 Tax=Streptomyces nitrosporeus TaxID=28894 RepID=UPI00332113FC
MNELSETRALRADAPGPGDERLAAQRARLLEACRREERGVRHSVVPPARNVRAALPGRRAVLLGAAVAGVFALAGGVVVTLPGDGPAAGPADGRRVLSARASADTLELAAATVEKRTATEPEPEQWVYEKTTLTGQGEPQTSEEWTRWDGTGAARLPGVPPSGDISGFDPDELQVWYGPDQEEKRKEEGYDDRSQRQFYRFLATLPSDPDRMMERIREEHAIGDIEGESRAERDWREVHVLYRSVLIPPNVQAGLFRALSEIPGVRVEKGVTDPLGRAAIAVVREGAGSSSPGGRGREEIFFDAGTYAYLGETAHASPVGVRIPVGEGGSVVPAPPGVPPEEAVVLDTGFEMTEVREAWGVVDGPGVRP